MPSAPSVVQAVTNHNSNAAFLAAPVTATTAGNLVVVIVQAYCATPVTGLAVSQVTLGAADNFTQAYSQTIIANTWVNSVWLDPSCSGGLTAADITLSGSNSSTQLNVIVYEITGWLPGYPLDILTTTYSTSPASSWSLAASDTQANALWIAALTSEGSAAFTVTGPSSPWVTNGTGTINNSVSPAFTRMQGWTNPQASQGPVTFSGTFSGSENWAAVLLAIPGSLTTGATSWAVSDPAAGTAGQAGVWGCPPGTATVNAGATGGGGAAGAGSGSGTGFGGGGGGAGEYAAEPSLTVTAGGLCQWVTGTAGSPGLPGGPGGNSTFTGTAVTVTAHGGNGAATGTVGSGPGAAGGTGSTNAIHFPGGSGAASPGASGGGGGGSGGTSAGGNAGSGGTGATAVTGGGPGGNAGTGSGGGSAPASGPGGGGGGSGRISLSQGGAGWAGQLSLTYTISPPPPSLIIPGPQPVRRASFW